MIQGSSAILKRRRFGNTVALIKKTVCIQMSTLLWDWGVGKRQIKDGRLSWALSRPSYGMGGGGALWERDESRMEVCSGLRVGYHMGSV